jgi:hypothetical protein
MTLKAVTEVSRPGNSFACPSTKNKNTHDFQKGLVVGLYLLWLIVRFLAIEKR